MIKQQIDHYLATAKHFVDVKIYIAQYRGRTAIRKVIDALSPLAEPDAEEIVRSLVMNTAALELVKGDHIELAPIQGTCGPILLSGNSLPVFEYRVFEKKLMEFIKVRVEVARPDQIRFFCTIDSEGTNDPIAHGQEVECKDVYQAPFKKLALSLFNYFPYYRKK